jgi:Ca2+-binding RTX toxin-like protein
VATIYSSSSLAALERIFFGDPVAQANQVILDTLQRALEFGFGQLPSDAAGSLAVTASTVRYDLNPASVAPAAVRVDITGAGFPTGATSLAGLSDDKDYQIQSVSVTVDDVPGTNFLRPASSVTLMTTANVESERLKSFALTGFTITAGSFRLTLSGSLATSLGTDLNGDVTVSRLTFNNANLSVTYDTDPSATTTKLAQIYLKGSFDIDLNNSLNPLRSASITDLGLKAFAGADLKAPPVHYLYAESLGIDLKKINAIPPGASTANALRSVFNGRTDVVYTWGNLDIPEGFERVVINGFTNVELFANGLNNQITGNAGNNSLYGDAGADTISAGAGNDSVYGGIDNDLLIGEFGNDRIDGGPGNDTLIGGLGEDVFQIASGADQITDLGRGGVDVLVVGAGATVNAVVNQAWKTSASTRNDGFANLSTTGLAVDLSAVNQGSRGFDLTNTGSATTLTGSKFTDSLTGGAGNDTLRGGAGADAITGGRGNDAIFLEEPTPSSDIVIFGGGTGGIGSRARVITLGTDNVSSLQLANGNSSSDVLCFLYQDFGIIGNPIRGSAAAVPGGPSANTDGNFYVVTKLPNNISLDLNGTAGDTSGAIVFVGAATGTKGVDVFFCENEAAFNASSSVHIAKLAGLNTANLDARKIMFPFASPRNFNGIASNKDGMNEFIVGSAQIDTVIYSAAISEYQITNSQGQVTVKNKSSAEEDRLIAVEYLRFVDKSITFDPNGNAAQVYRMYKAAFDRTPDNSFGYWIKQMDAGMNIVEVAARFINSGEFQNRYGVNPSNAEFLEMLYSNILDRAPDQAALGWWLNQMTVDPTKTRQKVLADFSESAENQANVASTIATGITFNSYWMTDFV